jgi:hypothetical protein
MHMATANGLYRTAGTVHSRYYCQTACTVPPVLFTAGIIANKLHDSLKLLDLLPAPCTKQQYLTHGVQSETFLAEQWIRSVGQ